MENVLITLKSNGKNVEKDLMTYYESDISMKELAKEISDNLPGKVEVEELYQYLAHEWFPNMIAQGKGIDTRKLAEDLVDYLTNVRRGDASPSHGKKRL